MPIQRFFRYYPLFLWIRGKLTLTIHERYHFCKYMTAPPFMPFGVLCGILIISVFPKSNPSSFIEVKNQNQVYQQPFLIISGRTSPFDGLFKSCRKEYFLKILCCWKFYIGWGSVQDMKTIDVSPNWKHLFILEFCLPGKKYECCSNSISTCT